MEQEVEATVEPVVEEEKVYSFKLSSVEEVEALEPSQIEKIEVKDITPEFLDLTREMLKYLVDRNAAGLSGVQIGINKAFFAYWNDKAEPRVVYNPTYYPDNNAKAYYVEGCLTYGPNVRFAVRRYKRIRAVWYDYDEVEGLVKRIKVLTGIDAEIFQHETDHCNAKTIAQIGQLVRTN